MRVFWPEPELKIESDLYWSRLLHFDLSMTLDYHVNKYFAERHTLVFLVLNQLLVHVPGDGLIVHVLISLRLLSVWHEPRYLSNTVLRGHRPLLLIFLEVVLEA